MKKVGIIMLVIGGIIALIALAISIILPLFSPSGSGVSESESSTIPTISNIEIIEWHLDEKYGTTYIVGELRNNNTVPTGIQLQAIVRDRQGHIIDSAEWWPASISNIPAGGIWPIKFGISDKENIETVEISVIRVKIWQ